MKFAAAINCMDGRVQKPVTEWMRRELGVDYIDVITEPGPNKILAENRDEAIMDSIKRRVGISVKKHNAKHVAVVGHHDCAGNPVDKENQIAHILTALKTVESWGFDARVIGLWVDENWKVHEVK